MSKRIPRTNKNILFATIQSPLISRSFYRHPYDSIGNCRVVRSAEFFAAEDDGENTFNTLHAQAHRWQFHKWKSKLLSINLSGFNVCSTHTHTHTPDCHHKLHCSMVVRTILSSFRNVCDDEKNSVRFSSDRFFGKTLLVFKLVDSFCRQKRCFLCLHLSVVCVSFGWFFISFPISGVSKRQNG